MIKLKNKFINMEINHLGAEITSIKKDGYEYLWQKDPEIWNGQALNLFPFIGRLKDEEYEYQQKMYTIKIHGFAKNSLFETLEQNDSYVSLRLTGGPESYLMYPFDFDFIVSYELIENTIKKQYMIINNGYKPMYYEVGGHEGYNLTFAKDKIMDDYYIEFSDRAVYTYTSDKDIMINEEVSRIELDTKRLYLNPKVFKNDALILDCAKLSTRKVILSATDAKRKIIVHFEDFDYLGIWTRPTYTGFVCIEPWSSLPDCNFLDKNIEHKIGIRTILANKSEMLEYLIEIV